MMLDHSFKVTKPLHIYCMTSTTLLFLKPIIQLFLKSFLKSSILHLIMFSHHFITSTIQGESTADMNLIDE